MKSIFLLNFFDGGCIYVICMFCVSCQRLKQLVTPHADLPQPKKYLSDSDSTRKCGALSMEVKDGLIAPDKETRF